MELGGRVLCAPATLVAGTACQKICHRDLKLENVLLDGSPAPRLKICDFGYSKLVDVWSCGVTLYVMLVGAYPFEDQDDPKNIKKTIQELGLAPWTGAKVQVPTKFIVGDGDLAYHHPGVRNYVHKGGLKRDVPLIDEVVVIKGVEHFIQQEKAENISDHIYGYINKFNTGISASKLLKL